MLIKKYEEINSIMTEGQRIESEIDELHKIARKLADGEISLNINLSYDDNKPIQDNKPPETEDIRVLFASFFDPASLNTTKKSNNKVLTTSFDDVESLNLVHNLIALRQAKLVILKNKLFELENK